MKKIIAFSVAATLMGTVAGVAQDAAGQQLSPTIGMQSGTALTLVDPSTGTVSTQTVEALPPLTVLGAVGGVVAGVLILDAITDDGDGDSDDSTGTTGS